MRKIKEHYPELLEEEAYAIFDADDEIVTSNAGDYPRPESIQEYAIFGSKHEAFHVKNEAFMEASYKVRKVTISWDNNSEEKCGEEEEEEDENTEITS